MADSFCVVTFHSTHLALEFERAFKEEGLKAKLIPVPRQISSSCGIAGRFSEELIEEIKSICERNGIEYEGIYRVYQKKGKKPEQIA